MNVVYIEAKSYVVRDYWNSNDFINKIRPNTNQIIKYTNNNYYTFVLNEAKFVMLA